MSEPNDPHEIYLVSRELRYANGGFKEIVFESFTRLELLAVLVDATKNGAETKQETAAKLVVLLSF